MPKQVTKLNEALPRRSVADTGRASDVHDRQRLADRLAQLAPLTREAVSLDEPDRSVSNPAVANEPDSGITTDRSAAQRPPSPSTPPPLPPERPKTALIVSQHSQPLVPVAPPSLVRLNGAPPPLPSLVIRPAIPKRRRKFGFLTGLSISIAMGAALYAALISLS